ncbi:MAG: outer membrane protein transport protein [Taibaiella sp.]|nr:outer membrane protein transport protein [Taibaiella sp.]
MYKSKLLLAIGICVAVQTSAQDMTNALRYSYLSPMGTARSIGFGNALGSIGGDFTSLSVNPAGIGIYRTSEIMFTPSLKINSVDGTYQGTTTGSNNTRFNFNNAGIVFSNGMSGKRYERSKWKAVSFGIGMNRLADFNRDYVYNGVNKGTASSSYSELFSIDANTPGTDINNPATLGGLAYQSSLIVFDAAQNQYKTIVPWKEGINQQRLVSERGGINEVVFSLGGNYMEQLMLGATIGVPIVNYTRNSSVTESAITPTTAFSSYTYSENLTTRGAGINLKLGAIYKPSDNFRLGFAIHTPTYYSLHDDYSSAIDNVGYNGPVSVAGSYDYAMVTPWRGIVSASGFAGKFGFITADYEVVDYSSAKILFNANAKDNLLQQAVNGNIKSNYTFGSIVRVGAEGRVTKNFMLRAGFGYYGSPYKNDNSANRIDISGGLGFRFDHWYIDMALLHTQYNNSEEFYSLNYTNPIVNIVQNATLKNSLNSAVMTLGFKF